ncbi:hypothetical protein J4T85_034395 (plasmid) [Sinorhizobium medicae]|uniref:hypothetical protein n=1 Tax=Sinorhizobium medicae TaxID=110321 RepID=UPI001F29C10F|nr:hypothetical protein [Sinorhizobium medicae]
MSSNQSFTSECDRAPRLNEMAEFFSTTAAGRSGVPLKMPDVDHRLFEGDPALAEFIDAHRLLWGNFDPHYFSSIPYRLEEEARLGDAMFRYGMATGRADRPATFYVLGSAEGTFARTLAQAGQGCFRTLSCSPNKENEESFYSHGAPAFAEFFLGPFHHLTNELIRTSDRLRHFGEGFDIILEDTTFQMYSPNRPAQIEFVRGHLKDEGIMIFVEKFSHDDANEYSARELQKDYGYKSRFFTNRTIERKNAEILSIMNKNENTIPEMAEAVDQHFRHAYITWNSGNFYTITASNSAENLSRYICSMVPPCIPNEYVYTGTPQSLLNPVIPDLQFRGYGRNPV